MSITDNFEGRAGTFTEGYKTSDVAELLEYTRRLEAAMGLVEVSLDGALENGSPILARQLTLLAQSDLKRAKLPGAPT